MTTARAPTIGDLLQTNTHLIVTCCRPGCRREERLSAARACELLGLETAFEGLERRLRCSRCGARGRDGFIIVRPCSLDQSAWAARQRAASAEQAGAGLGWDLEGYLATLRRLVPGGDLGGDGPVQWPVERSSKEL